MKQWCCMLGWLLLLRVNHDKFTETAALSQRNDHTRKKRTVCLQLSGILAIGRQTMLASVVGAVYDEALQPRVDKL